MNKMFPLPVTLVAVLVIVGCAGPPMKTIQIDSEPRGVRVECNHEDLGKTPTTFTVQTNPQGEFLGAWAGSPMVDFVAYPPHDSTNLYIQRKSFAPNGFFRAGDKIPARIFFDMHTKSERLDLNPDAK